MPARLITLGHINGVMGVKGWVKVFSHTRPREGIFDYGVWHLTRDGVPIQVVKLEQGRSQGKGLVAKLEGVPDRNAALALVGLEIQITRDVLPVARAGEYYWADLIGLNVVNLAGDDLGRVDYLIDTGANDVLVTQGQRERLIPLVFDQVIKDVDLAAGTLRVDWDSEF